MLLIHSFLKELPSHRHHGFNLQAGGKKTTTLRAVVRSHKCIPSWLDLNEGPLCFHIGDKEQNVELRFDATLVDVGDAAGKVARAAQNEPRCLFDMSLLCPHLELIVGLFLRVWKKQQKPSPRFWQCGPNEVFVSSYK